MRIGTKDSASYGPNYSRMINDTASYEDCEFEGKVRILVMSVNQPVFIIKVRLNEMLFPLKGRETKEKSSRVFALQWNVD